MYLHICVCGLPDVGWAVVVGRKEMKDITQVKIYERVEKGIRC